MYRRSSAGEIEVLLVHPGGPLWQNQDAGAWSIPKGEIDPGEEPFAAACREFGEETGFPHSEPYHDLGEIRQKSGKIVRVWAFEGDCDPATILSNTFSMRWPPRVGPVTSFVEVDRAEFFGIATAERFLMAPQKPLLDRLVSHLAL